LKESIMTEGLKFVIGSITTVAFIGLICLTSKEAYSEERLWSNGDNLIHARVGVLEVRDIRGSVYSVGVGWDHAYTDDFQLGAVVDYWDTEDRNVILRDLSVAVQGRFVFTETALPLNPYTGGGLALHRFQTETRQIRETGASPLAEDDRSKRTQNKVGIDLLLGGFVAVQANMDVHLEYRYRRMLDRGLGLAHSGLYAGISYRL